jgi:hypothetical protein
VETRCGEEQVSTAQDTWVVDSRRRRYCKIPRGTDPTDPRLPVRWLPYHRAWRDPRTGALTLALDPTETRRLRITPG